MTEIIKQEQGRSMVEMLGVLAVVGVLSVGGIAGYTYAMDKHKSNELLNEASKRAVVVAAQIAAGREPSLREFEDNTTAGGTISTEPATDIDGAVGIKVTGVKDSVCENLIKLENDRVYMAKDDASLTALTEADCTGDNATFLIVFEGMGGGTGEGTTVTCAESEKVSVTYTGGHCCDKTITEKFCPGDEPPTCVRDAGCDCDDGDGWADEGCCDELGGSYLEDDFGDYSICCVDGGALCPDEGKCICVPEGYSSDCGSWECKACSSAEGTAMCPEDGDCICVPDGYSAECSTSECITCSPEEGAAKCSYDGGCICVPDGYDSECDDYGCIACPSSQTPTCDGDGYCTCE